MYTHTCICIHIYHLGTGFRTDRSANKNNIYIYLCSFIHISPVFERVDTNCWNRCWKRNCVNVIWTRNKCISKLRPNWTDCVQWRCNFLDRPQCCESSVLMSYSQSTANTTSTNLAELFEITVFQSRPHIEKLQIQTLTMLKLKKQQTMYNPINSMLEFRNCCLFDFPFLKYFWVDVPCVEYGGLSVKTQKREHTFPRPEGLSDFLYARH